MHEGGTRLSSAQDSACEDAKAAGSLLNPARRAQKVKTNKREGWRKCVEGDRERERSSERKGGEGVVGEVTEAGCAEMMKNQGRGQVPPLKASLRLQGCGRGAPRSTPQGLLLAPSSLLPPQPPALAAHGVLPS